MLFQQGDTAAELGLGYVQGPAGGCEAAVLDHSRKVVEVVEVAHFGCAYADYRSINRTLSMKIGNFYMDRIRFNISNIEIESKHLLLRSCGGRFR